LHDISALGGLGLGQDERVELDHLRAENGQLHQLCLELEQALHDASQQGPVAELEARIQDYETLLEEKQQTICELHEQLQEARQLAADLEAGLEQDVPAQGGTPQAPRGPIPREEELLALSEELERERRQLQEDEQAVMEQMRQMEIGMARERAELARQRNDLQRLEAEVRHEIERAERSGGLQSRIENLKEKLQDATARRGAAPSAPQQLPPPQSPQPSTSTPTPVPQGKPGIMGRFFGRGS
jgi:hypothetical protein